MDILFFILVRLLINKIIQIITSVARNKGLPYFLIFGLTCLDLWYKSLSFGWPLEFCHVQDRRVSWGSLTQEEALLLSNCNLSVFAAYTILIGKRALNNNYRGGRLKGFIIWDVFTFIVCLLLFLFLSYGGSEKKEW